jgi:cytochrome P450
MSFYCGGRLSDDQSCPGTTPGKDELSQSVEPYGPATTTGPRFATEDIELAGQQIKQGDILFPVLLSANHDESQFTQPDDLDIARTLARHLAFGHGIHTCLGAPLARLEGDIALSTLLRRMPNLRLSLPRESITWHVNLNSWSLTALPVVF